MSLMFLGHVEAAQGHLAPAVERIVEGAALMRAIDNSLYLPWCLEGLAEAFAGQERWELVAMLSGSRDALYTDLALGVPPANPVAWIRTLDRARAALGNDGFAAAREAGRAWSPEEAIDRTRAIAQSG